MIFLKQFDKNVGCMDNSKDLKPNKYFNKMLKAKIGIVARDKNLQDIVVSEISQTE